TRRRCPTGRDSRRRRFRNVRFASALRYDSRSGRSGDGGMLGVFPAVQALQVSDGLLLVLVALELLRRAPAVSLAARPPGMNVAFVPLGIPLLAGPGAIAATMVYIRAASGFATACERQSALFMSRGVTDLDGRSRRAPWGAACCEQADGPPGAPARRYV